MPSPDQKQNFRRKSGLRLGLTALVALLFAGLIKHHLSPAEPSYNGLYLSTWLEEAFYVPGSDFEVTGVKHRAPAEAAIRALGPKAVPVLVSLLKYHFTPSPLRARFEAWLTNYPDLGDRVEVFLPDGPNLPFHFSVDRENYLPDVAYHGFSILGPLGQSAIPDLIPMLDNTNTGLKAAYCLREIGPASVPALTNALSSKDTLTKTFALIALGSLGPPAKPALPALVALTHDPDRPVAGEAFVALGQLGEAANLELPLLEESLTDTNYAEFAAYALSKSGHLEPLLQALTNEQEAVRCAAAVGMNRDLRLQGPYLWRPVYGPYQDQGGLDEWINKESSIARSPAAAQHLALLLLTNFDDPHDTVRALIATRLGEYGVKAWPALPALAGALSDRSEIVRQSAEAALQKMGLQMSEGGIVRGPRREKKIALEFTGHTFAEGGETILNELARHHAQASFFLTGDFLDRAEFRPLVARILGEGHYLGPHSDKHPLYCPWDGPKRTLITHHDFFDDLFRNIHKIEEHEKLATGPGPEPSIQRPRYWLPAYEWYNQDIVNWSAGLGIALVNYTPGTRSNADYTEESAKNFVSSQGIYNSIIKKEQEDPDGLNGFLLLLHLGAGPGRADKFSDHHFGELLDYLTARGYHLVRIDDLLDSK